MGLSPRMRGNPSPDTGFALPVRSIPAYAGEPIPARMPLNCGTVYPRVCGGTRGRHIHRRYTRGLSPRMRGNPAAAQAGRRALGSIPAYAGEPTRCRILTLADWVYPRVCGGTRPAYALAAVPCGLSPRMRGNRPAGGGTPPRSGSIPAYAGEPGLQILGGVDFTVYPRVCGGTRTGRSSWR